MITAKHIISIDYATHFLTEEVIIHHIEGDEPQTSRVPLTMLHQIMEAAYGELLDQEPEGQEQEL